MAFRTPWKIFGAASVLASGAGFAYHQVRRPQAALEAAAQGNRYPPR